MVYWVLASFKKRESVGEPGKTVIKDWEQNSYHQWSSHRNYLIRGFTTQ